MPESSLSGLYCPPRCATVVDMAIMIRREAVALLADPGRLLTPSETALVFGVDPKTVTRWADRGLLPTACRTLGGHRRYLAGDVADRLGVSTSSRADR